MFARSSTMWQSMRWAAFMAMAPFMGCQMLPPKPVPALHTAHPEAEFGWSKDSSEIAPAGYEPPEKLPAPLPDGEGEPDNGEEELREAPRGLIFRGGPGEVPRELNKGLMAAYVIEPPDILLIEATPSLPGYQAISGEYLVRPDGTVGLPFGAVRVAGLTLDEAQEKITDFLAGIVRNPRVFVDVFTYNSKVYYVIADGAGFGQQVNRLSWVGNETVLDAISQVGGLPTVASKKRIWVARPVPGVCGSCEVLPVDWKGISQCADTSTNYQIWPGDRIFIESDRLLAFDGCLSKILAPIERLFGVTLLGATTVKQLQNMGRNTGGTTVIVP